MQKIISLDLKNIKRRLTGGERIITLSFVSLIAGIFVFSLTFYNSAFASENISTNVSIEPSLTVTIPSTPLVLNLDPASTTSGSNNLTITVGTNNATGYKMTMSTTSDNTNLVHTEDSTIVIPTLDTGTSFANLSDFPVNKWGYKKDSGNFIPFTSPTTILESDTYANDDTTTLSFATKIDYLQESGTYNTTFQFNTVANPLAIYMQNWTGCSAMNIGDTITLTDSRDNEEYLVGKLADGNCWTLENLRLDLSDSTVQSNLDSTTTNATDTILGYLKNGGGSSPYPANGVVDSTGWTNDWGTNPHISTEYKDTIQPESGSAPAGRIGVYYNYCAASAASYCYGYQAGSGNAQYDICPIGWQIPLSAKYGNLYKAYSSNAANFMASLSTPASGAVSFSSASGLGVNGYFWSSNIYNGTKMYYLSITYSGKVTTNDNYNTRGNGYSVRCILKES